MKWLVLLLFSASAMANYSTQETEALVQDLQEFQDELEVSPKKKSPRKKRILSLADILNGNKTESKEVAAKSNKEVMDLDSIFEQVKGQPQAQPQPAKRPSRTR